MASAFSRASGSTARSAERADRAAPALMRRANSRQLGRHRALLVESRSHGEPGWPWPECWSARDAAARVVARSMMREPDALLAKPGFLPSNRASPAFTFGRAPAAAACVSACVPKAAIDPWSLDLEIVAIWPSQAEAGDSLLLPTERELRSRYALQGEQPPPQDTIAAGPNQRLNGRVHP